MPDHFTTLQSKGLTIYQRDDLPEGLTANAKLFADDTLLFLVAHDPTGSSVSLKNDLLTISQWVYQWKMIFNPDISKKTQEVALFWQNNCSLPCNCLL